MKFRDSYLLMGQQFVRSGEVITHDVYLKPQDYQGPHGLFLSFRIGARSDDVQAVLLHGGGRLVSGTFRDTPRGALTSLVSEIGKLRPLFHPMGRDRKAVYRVLLNLETHAMWRVDNCFQDDEERAAAKECVFRGVALLRRWLGIKVARR